MIDPDVLLARRCPASEMAVLSGAGVYAFYLTEREGLPATRIEDTGLLYVGMTEQGLEARNHFRQSHSGFSTFRRSLGALLKGELDLIALPRSAGTSNSNTRCYRFTDEGERALTKWMSDNLLCAQVEIEGDIAGSERALIEQMEPPLNLKGWRNPQAPTIKALRAQCAAEAERHRME